MVALAPIADVVHALYPQKSTTNGIFHSEKFQDATEVPIIVEAPNLAPTSEIVRADSVEITANGNASTQHEQNSVNSNGISAFNSGIPSNERNMAYEILQVIERYGVDYEKSGGSWKGLESFVPTVVERVKRQEPIRMILPAFPFKSPNARDKVLGIMPDFGEELALAHLNGLCENIAQVYKQGAEIYISSDGLVYNGKPLTNLSSY